MESGLQGCHFIKLVEDFFGLGVTFEVHDDAHPFSAVGLVAQVANPLDFFGLDKLRQPHDKLGFIDLVGQLANDDAPTAFFCFFNGGYAANNNFSPAC